MKSFVPFQSNTITNIHGQNDAKDAGNLMGERGMKFDVAFTSDLERAWRTCAIVLAGTNKL